jgi:ECF sigma factor
MVVGYRSDSSPSVFLCRLRQREVAGNHRRSLEKAGLGRQKTHRRKIFLRAAAIGAIAAALDCVYNCRALTTIFPHKCQLNERREHTLQTSALVNKAYLRLVDHSASHSDSGARLEHGESLAAAGDDKIAVVGGCWLLNHYVIG